MEFPSPFGHGAAVVASISIGEGWLVLLLVAVVALATALHRASRALDEARRLRADVDALRRRLAALEAGPKPDATAPQAAHEGAIALPESEPWQPAAPAATTAPAGPSAPAPQRASDVEAAVGLTWATRLGAVTLLAGLVYFFKVAVSEDWLGPLGRVLVGASAGLGLLGLAEALGRRVDARWRDVAAGSGLAILLVTVWAAHAWYALLPAVPAFAAFAAVVALGGALAWRAASQPLLVTALAAGLANPFLLAPGAPSGLLLVGWMVPLTTGALAIARRRAWPWAAAVATLGGAALLAGWAALAPDPGLPAPLIAATLLALAVAAAARRWPGAPDFADALLAAAPVALVLTTGLLLRAHPVALPLALGAVLLVAAAALLALGRAALVVPALASAAALVLASPERASPALHLAWAAPPWLAALASSLRPVPAPRLLAWALALPTLAVGTFAATAPAPSAPLLAALAAANLATAVLLVRRGHLQTAGLAIALAAAGAAVAILFAADGPGRPLAWAALGAALALAGRRTAVPHAVASGAALVALAAVHLLALDFWAAPAPLAGPLDRRALVLLATGLATLAVARAARPPLPFALPAGAFPAALTAGHALLVGAAITVAVRLFGLDAAPPDLLSATVDQAAADAALTRKAAIATLTLGVYGAAALALGFLTRAAHRRWVGLTVLAVTLVKLALVDIWSLTRLQQMVVLLVVGALLLTCGLLYARHAERIKRLIGQP